jgi:predicted dehydrogenase
MNNIFIDLDYKPHLPPKMDYGIAMIGCGGIVRDAALPCYVQHNLNVIGCYDLNCQAAEDTARKFGISKVYSTLEDLLADPAVEIVEISVVPWNQLAIASKVISAGKHILCQKPLSDNYADAVKIVRLAREAGVKLAVNEQMRWDQATRATRTLLREGWIGKPTDATIQTSLFANPTASWAADLPRYEVLFHSIHYIDSMRFLFGEPEWVTSRHAGYPLPGKVRGETRTITILDYPTGLQVLIGVNLSNPSDDKFVIFRFIGTEGVISGTIGLLQYPAGQRDTLVWSSTTRCPGTRFEEKLQGAWFPDAFIGPMGSLMQAIQENGVPETDGADNLNTLRIVEAAYASAAQNRSIRLSEIELGLNIS